jgi:hypothetical protein
MQRKESKDIHGRQCIATMMQNSLWSCTFEFLGPSGLSLARSAMLASWTPNESSKKPHCATTSSLNGRKQHWLESKG